MQGRANGRIFHIVYIRLVYLLASRWTTNFLSNSPPTSPPHPPPLQANILMKWQSLRCFISIEHLLERARQGITSCFDLYRFFIFAFSMLLVVVVVDEKLYNLGSMPKEIALQLVVLNPKVEQECELNWAELRESDVVRLDKVLLDSGLFFILQSFVADERKRAREISLDQCSLKTAFHLRSNRLNSSLNEDHHLAPLK